MRTAIDSSVLLDVLTDSAEFADRSEAALRKAMSEGGLIVCESVVAEIRPALPQRRIAEFLADWQLSYVPSSLDTALFAGSMFDKYLRRGGRRKRIVVDFLVGAHAVKHADRLLARDRGYLRDYFSALKLMTP